MLFQSWSIALSVCSAGVVFLGCLAVVCGVRVLRFWDHGADTARQIRLEGEIWLTSALMEYGLFFQLLSLLLLVLAADSFSGQLVGAMCATGAFLANDFGIPALLTKIFLAFFCACWLLLHRLDIQSESYPLVKAKYLYLLVLVPLLVVDALLQSLYLYHLEPDVITSCCGVIFRPGAGDGYNLLDSFPTSRLLSLFYGLAATLMISGLLIHYSMKRRGKAADTWLIAIYTGGWTLFFPVAIWAIIVVFSSYIYAMPFHRCPFDILQAEYNYIGFPIYVLLFSAVFLGIGCGIAHAVRAHDGLSGSVLRFQLAAVPASLSLLLLFLLFTGYAPLRYVLSGGEV